ncbi:MAG: hypothetical protein MI919_24825, partial [Holophagales bacterium]|nr:hypothetical protein [Holophagales bacterium]
MIRTEPEGQPGPAEESGPAGEAVASDVGPGAEPLVELVPRRRARALVALLLWVALAVAAVSSWRDWRRAERAEAFCARVEAGDWRAALVEGPSLVGELGMGEAALRTTECLALAHFGA